MLKGAEQGRQGPGPVTADLLLTPTPSLFQEAPGPVGNSYKRMISCLASYWDLGEGGLSDIRIC